MNDRDGAAGGEGSAPEMRIGTAERESAAKALDEHLDAGRLGVEEYADRAARAANAEVAQELTELFTDLPAPHPVVPGTVAPAPPPTVGATVERGRPSALDVWGPRMVAATPIIALLLFLATGTWWFFLLVPLAGALVYGGKDHLRREQRHAERDGRRAARREIRDKRRRG